MMRFWPLALALALVLQHATEAQAEALPDRARMIQLSASLVKVQGFDAHNRTYFGSGVVLAPGRVATNCHVTRHGVQIVIVYRGHTHEVTGQHADIEHDLCILAVPTLPVAALPYLPSETLQVGQAVWAMSFEGGAGIQLRSGIIRGLHRHDQARIIESSTAFTSGASGGALLNAHGQVIGLLTYRLRGDPRAYYAVPLDWVVTAIGASKLPAVVPVIEGAAFWQRASGQLPYFLRAHRFLLEGNGPGLLQLSEEWLRTQPDEADAWWTHGAAQEMLERTEAAIAAYRKTLGLDPGNVSALLRLGRLSVRRGEDAETQRIMSSLSLLDADLAKCLASPPATLSSSPSESSRYTCDEIP